MRIKISGKPIEEVFEVKSTVKKEYSDFAGYTVMAIGFSIVFALLQYWGWLW